MTKEEIANLGVGETFQLGCRKFTVVETDDETVCEGCFFDESYIHCTKLARDNFIPECCWENRKDEKNVIFIEGEE